MKRTSVALFFIIWILAACQSGIALPQITAQTDTEFALFVGQSAALEESDLHLTLNSILDDNRCPIRVECVASGPVSISLSIQPGNGEPTRLAVSRRSFDQDRRF